MQYACLSLCEIVGEVLNGFPSSPKIVHSSTAVYIKPRSNLLSKRRFWFKIPLLKSVDGLFATIGFTPKALYKNILQLDKLYV